MPRLQALTDANAGSKVEPLFDGINKKLGKVPNIMRTMANSPAVLKAYLGFSSALAEGTLSAKLREQIALTVGEANNCQYCLAAHSALGRKAGLSDDDITASRSGRASDPKAQAAIQFARKLVSERGWVSDGDVDQLRKAGFDDGGIAEIVAVVSLNLFTNYFNHVAETDVDFPAVQPV